MKPCVSTDLPVVGLPAAGGRTLTPRASSHLNRQHQARRRTRLVELGHHAATELGQSGVLEATASLWRKDQGHRSRIDRMYCTPDLAPALMSLEVVADEAVAEVSGHALVVAVYDRTAFRRALTPTQ